MTLEERIKQLEKVQARFPGELRGAVKGATLRAVEKAEEMTPPTGEADDLKGTHTRTGAMKQRWRADSQVSPTQSGLQLTTILANRAGFDESSENDTSYASYVNDGHRMDRHFVPGLYINPESGHLEYDPSAKGGLIVGTKTTYVKGIGMVDAAKEEYRRVLKIEADKLMERMK